MAIQRLTFSEIVDEVRQRLQMPVSVAGTDASIADSDHIKRRINTYHQKWAYRAPEIGGIPGLVGEFEFSIAAGESSEPCPADFIQAMQLWERSGPANAKEYLEVRIISNRKRDANRFRLSTSDNLSDREVSVYFQNNVIVFDGAAQNITNPVGDYTMLYYQCPDTLVDDDDVTVWPAALDDILIESTVASIHSDGKKLPFAQALNASAETKWKEFRALHHNNQGIRNFRIQDAANYRNIHRRGSRRN